MSGFEDRGGELLDALRETRSLIEKGDAKTMAKIGNAETAIARLNAEINNIHKRMQRPGGYAEIVDGGEPETDHAAARNYLDLKHATIETKAAADDEPRAWTSEQIDQAIVARKAIKRILRRGEASLTPDYKKALTAFSMGANSFILPAEMSNEILSCLVYPSDLASLVRNIAISGPSIRFLVDNVILDQASWACETSCFANNPQQHLNEGLGELEFKAETIRYILCSTRDILEDAATNVEAWMLGKVQRELSASSSATPF